MFRVPVAMGSRVVSGLSGRVWLAGEEGKKKKNNQAGRVNWDDARPWEASTTLWGSIHGSMDLQQPSGLNLWLNPAWLQVRKTGRWSSCWGFGTSTSPIPPWKTELGRIIGMRLIDAPIAIRERRSLITRTSLAGIEKQEPLIMNVYGFAAARFSASCWAKLD